MNIRVSAVRKAPGAVVVSLSVLIFFAASIWFGSAMVDDELWNSDSRTALGYSWANMGGLYFGLLAPILIAAVAAILVNPEKQRGNLNWIRSQPRGVRYLMREKVIAVSVLCLGIAVLQLLVVVTFGAVTGTLGDSMMGLLALYTVLTGVGMFSVASFYLWISTYTDSLASTLGVAVGLTVATMGLSIVNQLVSGANSIERVLPTAQIVSTSFARSPGEEGVGTIALATVLSLAWAAVFLFLTSRRLRK